MRYTKLKLERTLRELDKGVARELLDGSWVVAKRTLAELGFGGNYRRRLNRIGFGVGNYPSDPEEVIIRPVKVQRPVHLVKKQRPNRPVKKQRPADNAAPHDEVVYDTMFGHDHVMTFESGRGTHEVEPADGVVPSDYSDLDDHDTFDFLGQLLDDDFSLQDFSGQVACV